jgi:adenylosuccinate synthase
LPCSVVVGGFWGDEGKGKIVSYLALRDKVDFAVRGGSINAGHTVVFHNTKYSLRMIPGAFVYEKCRLLIGPGANVSPRVFMEEVEKTGVRGRVGLDTQCSIIEDQHVSRDKESPFLSKQIGTTGSGVGPALEDRVKRVARLARDIDELKPFLTDVPGELGKALDNGRKVVVEGTQGTFLSLFHGTYPYCTGRDTTASALCSEVGIGPTSVDNVLLVFKAFMTRVGSGYLPGELPEEEVIKRGWAETGTVTGRKRRAAPFNFELAQRAVLLNSATSLAITKFDVLFQACSHANVYDDLPNEAKEFVDQVERRLGVPVDLIGTGPDTTDIIDRR